MFVKQYGKIASQVFKTRVSWENSSLKCSTSSSGKEKLPRWNPRRTWASNNFQGLSIIFKSTLFAYLHLEWLIFTLCDVCMPCLDLDTHMFATMLLTHLCLDLHAHVLDIMSMVMPCLDLHVCMHVLCSYALCRHMLVCLYLCSSMFLCSHPHA